MITISRDEYEKMQAELRAVSKELDGKNRELDGKSRELTAALLANDWLMEQLKLNKKRMFGSSSKKSDECVMEQMSLVFN